MKKIRKGLAFVVAVATLGTVSAIPTSAEVTYVNDAGEEGIYYDTYEEYYDSLSEEEREERNELGKSTYLEWFVFHNPHNSPNGGDVSAEPTISNSTATDDDITLGDSTEPSETTLQRGDVNGDGTINALDLLQLKKYILGIIDSLE